MHHRDHGFVVTPTTELQDPAPLLPKLVDITSCVMWVVRGWRGGVLAQHRRVPAPALRCLALLILATLGLKRTGAFVLIAVHSNIRILLAWSVTTGAHMLLAISCCCLLYVVGCALITALCR